MPLMQQDKLGVLKTRLPNGVAFVAGVRVC